MPETTIKPMVRVRRWRWWPFAHRYVVAPRMNWDDLLVLQAGRNETMQVMAAGVMGLIVKREETK